MILRKQNCTTWGLTSSERQTESRVVGLGDLEDGVCHSLSWEYRTKGRKSVNGLDGLILDTKSKGPVG